MYRNYKVTIKIYYYGNMCTFSVFDYSVVEFVIEILILFQWKVLSNEQENACLINRVLYHLKKKHYMPGSRLLVSTSGKRVKKIRSSQNFNQFQQTLNLVHINFF